MIKKILTLYISFFFLILSSAYLLGQEVVNIHFLSNKNVPFSTVYGNICQDDDGYLWFGTDKGLFRYDGTIFYKSQMDTLFKSQTILGLQISSNGFIACYNNFGQIGFKKPYSDSLFYFKPTEALANQKFHLIGFLKDLLIVSSKFSDKLQVFSFDISKGTIAELTSLGSSYLFPPIYIIEEQLFYLNKEQIFKQLDAKYLEASLIYPHYFTINKGFIGLEEKKQNRFKLLEINQQSNKTIEPNPFFTKQKPNHLFRDKKDKLWLSMNDGVLVLDSSFRPKTQLFKGTHLHNSFQDREKGYWFGSLKEGLFFVPEITTQLYTKENSNIESDYITHIDYLSENDWIFGTKEGTLHCMSHDTLVSTYQLKNCSLLRDIIIDRAKKKIYIATSSTSDKVPPIQVMRLDNGVFIKEKELIHWPQNLHKNLAFAPNKQSIYIANNKSIDQILIAKKHIDLPTFSSDLIRENNTLFTDLFYPRVWIGETYGLHYHHIPTNTIHNIKQEGLAFNASVSHIAQTADSIIWVGTSSSGVFGIKDDSIIHHFNVEHGLLSNTCTALFANRLPFLWIGTPNGISQLNLQTMKFSSINSSDGLLTEDVKTIYQQDENLWVGTSNGLFQLNVKAMEKSIVPPLIHVTTVKIWEKDTVFEQGTTLTLPYHQNNIYIEFKGISFKSFNKITYKYRMLGIDTSWTFNSINDNYARFPQLQEGNYTFEVKAINSDDIESIETAQLSFYILPPFWRTWWFLTLLFFIIPFFISVIIYLIFNQKRIRKEKEKYLFDEINLLKRDALKSQMNPHFIFNALNAISLFLVKNDQKSAILFLSKFARLIRSIFEYSRQDKITIAEEIQFLETYLKLENLRFKDKITIQIDIDEILRHSNFLIPPFLVQPIIENSFKHGLFHKEDKGLLILKICNEQETIKIVVEDNGIGRKKANEILKQKRIQSKISSNKIIEERISLLNQQEKGFSIIHLKVTDILDKNDNEKGLRTEFIFKKLDFMS